MEKYIKKSDIVAEIEKLKAYLQIPNAQLEAMERVISLAKIDMCKEILSFLDTLEVKEVDLEKEMDFVKDAYYYFTSDERDSIMKVARHFFELGLKTKGE